MIHTLTGVIGTEKGAVSADVAMLRVTGKQVVAGDVLTLELASPQGLRLRDWSPGAHIDLVLPNGMTRQYSLCGDRWDPFTYRVGVLRESSGRGGSAFVHDELDVGDLVGVGGPRNNFALVPSEEYLFVAGGIGITPLLPMVAQAELLGADWRLLYGGRTRASMAFLDELVRLRRPRAGGVAGRARTAAPPAGVPRRPPARGGDLLLRPGRAARGDGDRLRRTGRRTRCAPSGSWGRSWAVRCARRRSRSSSPAPAPP